MKFIHLLISLICLNLTCVSHAGLPLWGFVPDPSFPAQVSVTSTGTATVKYTVSNNSSKVKELLMQPIRGVRQVSTCILQPKGAPNSSCILELIITGSALPAAGISGGPVLCLLHNSNQCYRPSQKDSLSIRVSSDAQPPLAAAGFYNDGTNSIPLLANSIDGGATWGYSIPGVAAFPAGFVSGNFNSVSCQQERCLVAGVYNNVTSNFPLLGNSTDGGMTWAYSINSQTPSLPSDFIDGNFQSISCSGSNCIVAGSYGNGTTMPLMASSSDQGVTWTYVVDSSTSAALPAGLTFAYLKNASCSGSHCIAVGGYQASTFAQYLVKSNDAGVTWTLGVDDSTPALPSGYIFGYFNAGSCSGQNCIAVGSAMFSPIFQARPLVASSTDGGSTWAYTVSTTSSILPSNITTGELKSASCSGQYCIAAGIYNIGGAHDLPFLISSTDGGATWTSKIYSGSTTEPTNFNYGSFLSASCAGPHCVAAGSYNNGGANDLPLLASSADGGVTWSYTINTTTPTPPSDFDSGLFNGVSCTDLHCVAVGTYFDGVRSLPLLANSIDGGGSWVYAIHSTKPALPSVFSYGSFSSVTTNISSLLGLAHG